MKEIIGYGMFGAMGLFVLYFFIEAWKDDLFRFLVWCVIAGFGVVGFVALALWLIVS